MITQKPYQAFTPKMMSWLVREFVDCVHWERFGEGLTGHLSNHGLREGKGIGIEIDPDQPAIDQRFTLFHEIFHFVFDYLYEYPVRKNMPEFESFWDKTEWLVETEAREFYFRYPSHAERLFRRLLPPHPQLEPPEPTSLEICEMIYRLHRGD